MEAPRTSERKPRLTKEGLAKHDVVYKPKVLDTSDWLPENVAMVRDALLRFNKKIHIASRSELEVDLNTITATCAVTLSALPGDDDSYWTLPKFPRQMHQKESEELQEIISRSEGLADDFKALKNEAEATWTHRLIADIFQRYDVGAMNRSGKLHMFEQWCLEENTLWSAQPNMEKAPDGPYLTTPKPDLTYAYPLFRPTDDVPRLFSTWECTTFYSTGLVQDLKRKGVNCTLTNNLFGAKEGTPAFEGLRKPDLTAFPWAVVEVKPDDVSDATEEFCFNQAANASAAAVRMYKRLVDLCQVLEAVHIPPVVAFTCVGAAVRVWLTYFDRQAQKTWMVCIWSANLKSVWGVLSVQLIVENMRSWALTALRNLLNIALWGAKVSMCTGQPSSAKDVESASGESMDEAARSTHGSTEADTEERKARLDVPNTPPTSIGSNSPDLVAAPGTGATAADAHVSAGYDKHFDLPQSRLYRSPGQDSGIGSDVGSSPAQVVSARSLRDQNKMASDARVVVPEQHTTPSKVPSRRGVDRAFDGRAVNGNDPLGCQPTYRSVAPSVASLESEATSAVLGSSSTPSVITRGIKIGDDTREPTPVQTSSSPRPSAHRQTSRVAKDLVERAQALTGDMVDRLSKHNAVQYPDLTHLLAQEASRQRQSATGTLVNPAMMSESPVQTPLREAPGTEPDDNSSMRPSISSRHSSFFSRRSSSKALQNDWTPRSPSKSQTDASSELPVSSSRPESVVQKARQHTDVFVAEVRTSLGNLDFKGTADNVKKVSAQAVQRFKSKEGEKPAAPSDGARSADHNVSTRDSLVGDDAPEENVSEEVEGAGSETMRRG